MLADVIGRDDALKLIASLPRVKTKGHPLGQPVLYVPKTLPPDHAFVRTLGYPVALRLVRAFGGEMLYPAACVALTRAERNRSIMEKLRDGCTEQEVARLFGLTRRHIRNIQRENAPVDDGDGSAQHSHTFESLVAA
jgi:hypothetical protein